MIREDGQEPPRRAPVWWGCPRGPRCAGVVKAAIVALLSQLLLFPQLLILCNCEREHELTDVSLPTERMNYWARARRIANCRSNRRKRKLLK